MWLRVKANRASGHIDRVGNGRQNSTNPSFPAVGIKFKRHDHRTLTEEHANHIVHHRHR